VQGKEKDLKGQRSTGGEIGRKKEEGLEHQYQCTLKKERSTKKNLDIKIRRDTARKKRRALTTKLRVEEDPENWVCSPYISEKWEKKGSTNWGGGNTAVKPRTSGEGGGTNQKEVCK